MSSPYLDAPRRSLADVLAERRMKTGNGRARAFRINGATYTALRFFDHDGSGDRMVAGRNATGEELHFRTAIVEWLPN